MTIAALPAIVVGGGVNALSIARGLGRRGINVDVLADIEAPNAARYSRYCRRYLPMARPLQEHWLDWLTGAGAEEPAALLPGSDEGLELIVRNRSRLEGCGHRPFEANDDVTLALLDKATTYELAATMGTAAPSGALIASLSDIDLAAQTIPLPAVLKPQVSHVFLRSFAATVKGQVIARPSQLAAAAMPMIEAGVPMVLTELVPGPHDAYCSYYTYLDENGEPLIGVTKRKLRQYPIGFGEGTYHAMASEPEAAEIGLRFFQSVGIRGLANVEFKRDARDGALKLIECNLRFTQADALLRRAGVDLPLLAYSRLAGWPVPPMVEQQNGLHLWFPRQDVRAFLAYRRVGEIGTGEWLRSLGARKALPLFDWRDPAPSVRELGRRVSKVPSKVVGRRDVTVPA